MLYTIVPIEDIFSGAWDAGGNRGAGLTAEGLAAPPVELPLGGRRLIVSPQPDGSARLVRLISTDPADYLDPRWQPGAAVSLPPCRR